MRPEGPWQRLAAALADSSDHFPAFNHIPSQIEMIGHSRGFTLGLIHFYVIAGCASHIQTAGPGITGTREPLNRPTTRIAMPLADGSGGRF